MSPSSSGFLVGLIGTGIGPSLTPPLHEREADQLGVRYLYRRLDLDELHLPATAVGEVLAAARLAGYDGLNVTHPCKQLVLGHLDELSPDAEALGAVNTVVLRGGRAVGHNTDWSGFARAFDRGLPDAALDRVVLLGAGGAGAAVAHALLTLGTGRLTVLDVDGDRATALAAALAGRFGEGRAVGGDLGRLGADVPVADGLVHATPTGMAAHPGLPLPADLLRPDLWVSDIVYRPLETALVRTARELGCRVLDGGGMAVYQAVDAFRLFTDLEPDPERMLAHFTRLVAAPGSDLRIGLAVPRRSIATVCLSGTLEDKLAAAAAAGFDGVEVFEPDLVASPEAPAGLAARCADLGLSVDLYQPFRDLDSTDPDRFARNLRRAGRKFDVMAALGVDTVLVCSSVAPDAVADVDQLAGQLAAAADAAGARGLRIAYEALAWGTHVSTWDRSWDAVRRADSPALGLCLDSFHVLSRGGDPAGFAGVPGEKLFYLQLADAPALQMDVLQWSRHHRLFPGQGAFDLPAFLDAVLSAGYAGPLSLEVFNDVYRQSDPARTAVDAMRSLLWLEEQHALRQPAGVPAAPAAPELTGYSFTELAVDGISGPQVAGVLGAMGFTHTGQHRSKPVQQWEQGPDPEHRARVLLNASVVRPAATGVAAVTALGLESTDPGRSAQRAEAFRAPVLPRTRGAAEAELSAVAAPDGTSVFFTRTGPEGWPADFLPTGAAPGPGAGLTGVDHVGLTQPFDSFDEAGLFYRAVLGLEPQAVTEVAAPYGLVRTRAVTGPARAVRLALSASTLRRGGWAPTVPDPQHVAFATDDVVATARALRAAGAPLLPLPANYADDLAARYDLAPDLLAAIREHGLMYDEDAGGSCLHLATEVLGDRVFFVVTQRLGGYDGYGTADAPVRMAAHRRRRRAALVPSTG